MHVLDLGCGIGEVSLIASRLVGPHGSVLGLDIDEGALTTARGRGRSAGHDHLSFQQQDVMEFQPDRPFDAVIGRHILIHTKDPLAIVKKAVSLLHPGGLIAFQEYDLSYTPPGYPSMPLSQKAYSWVVDLFLKASPHPDIGVRLFQLMQKAGLPPPECRLESIIDGGPHSPVFEWLAETVRSLLPKLEALGIATAAEADIDTMADRLRDEALQMQGCLVVSPMIGAFARKPYPG